MTKHVYHPRGTCIELFNSREPQVLFAGPAGTGKSRACLEKVHAMCLANPGMRALMVRKTAVSLSSTALVTYEEHVATEHIANGDVRWFGGSAKEAASYRYGNGSTITVGGMDKPMKVMSSEYDICYVQEATELTENDWESITTRLRNGKVSFQQLIADANPDMPTHWLKVRCDEGRTKYIASRHEDNPVLYTEAGELTARGRAYMAGLDALTGVRYQRLRRGLWVAAEGLIYDEYDPAVHLRRAMAQPPKDWPVYLSIDFGYTNPFVCQFWTEDPDGRLILYREIYKTQTIVEDHAKAIQAELKRQRNPRVSLVICDHDAEDRATLERHLGMSTTPATKTVSDGLQAVKARLRVQGDGKPRLLICRDALVERDEALAFAKKPLCTEQEVVGYIWDEQPNKPPKEVPVKKDDHGMDALRYMIAKKDLVGRARIRTLGGVNRR
jgi:phage terminase large subunit